MSACSTFTLPEAATARLHDEKVAGDLALHVAEDLDAPSVADVALEEGVFLMMSMREVSSTAGLFPNATRR
ncbi:MAG: hypothetical protein WDN31_17900 [Hyphomicrobium sp.]